MKTEMRRLILLLLLPSICLIFTSCSSSIDTITESSPLKDGDTIVSSGGNFEFGFFSPAKNSGKRYLGVWYKKISEGTVIWVANRDSPLFDSSGTVKITAGKVLTLFGGTNRAIWSSNSSASTNGSVVVQLLDTGNLVLRPIIISSNSSDSNDYLWQSFDYPGDTFMPGMKYGIDLKTGLNRVLTASVGPDDPTSGDYTNGMDPYGLPEFYLKKGSEIQFRSGSWNGLRFSGMPNLKPNIIYNFTFVFTDEEVYYTYHLADSSVVSRMVLSSNGVLQRFTWVDYTKSWTLYLTAQMDNCDRYNLCGPYGTCDINNSPACGCLKGFVPRNPQYWAVSDWSEGCVRKKELTCQNGEGFLKYSGLKQPDTSRSWYNKTMNLEECSKVCLRNCSCMAYANMDVRNGGSGCVLWFGELFDIREYNENGQDIYVRLSASEIAKYKISKGRKKIALVAIPVVFVVFIALWLIFLIVKKKNKQFKIREVKMIRKQEQEHADETDKRDVELPLLDIATIITATNNFLEENKLGQGGFGPVYKGTLSAGQEIAIKRLSKSSRQGLDEFKNEVLCISKLQHRNLVKLLGCCIQEDERMLVYEYMSNKSLDFFIFDEKRRTILDWPKRFQIINGIARGLLYLHQDSRLRIIHRDLKTSNILLDRHMIPKISDFGMARSFGGDESGGNTNRVVGTYGYMSPEYAIDGLFSVKSDVFSFGVVVLEIVSGKRNRRFTHPDHKLNLLGHAWRLLMESKSQEIIDESTRGSCNLPETLRSIHIALLCVQQSPDDRPNMSQVVLMLSSDILLPLPKEPGFFNERDLSDAEYSTTNFNEISTSNGMTMSVIEGR